MRFLLAALASVLAVIPVAHGSSGPLFSSLAPSPKELENMFTQWMRQYNKVYSFEEFSSRFEQFKENVAVIRQHNVESSDSFTLGLNQFADLSQQEFKNLYVTGFTPKNCAAKSRLDSLRVVANPPASIDWRTKGAVSPVVSTGNIGESWPFAAGGAIEGAWVTQGDHALETVSAQFLFDCCKNETVPSVDNAFQCVIAAGGACSVYSKGQCNSCAHDIKISGYQDIATGDENGLLNAVGNIGPVSVGIEADSRSFQLYAGGVFSATCGTKINYDMLVVGYGTDSGTDYWIVKNSWGASWGESGYIRLIRGKNECGIAVAASYPTV